jgi:hypothetical protein
MKFTTMLLCEHAIVTESGLISMLNGAANHVARPIFPAPFGLTLVAVIQLSSDYQDHSNIPVEFTVTSPDDSEVFGRVKGDVQAVLLPGTDRRAATATVVLDLSGVPLTKAGLYKVNGAISGTVSQSIYLEVSEAAYLEVSEAAQRSAGLQTPRHQVETPGTHGS